jgi:phosphoenolpyruvate synthase/pyruvate phosphate dikinase
MNRLGLPVPDGFIILSDTSKEYMAINHANSDIDYFTEEKILPDNFEKDYLEGIKALEIKTSRKFGQIDDDSSSFPLLLSVRASSEVKSEGYI